MIDWPSDAQLRRVVGAARAVDRAAVIVAVDGRSGSGKTTFADALRTTLSDATVVHLDDMYPGWDGLAAAPSLVAEMLLPLRRGEPASYRRFDWVTGEFGEEVGLPESHYLIIEGAGSSAGPARAYTDLRVWLEADESTRKHRALTRDGDAYRPHWQRWADQEVALFAADHTRDHADLILRTD